MFLGYKYNRCENEQDEEYRHLLRIENKILSIIHKLASTYKWNTDLEMPSTIVETLLSIHGCIGTKDGETIGFCVPSKIWDKKTGLPSAYTITYLDGTQESDVPASDIVVCFNGYRAIKSDLYLCEIAGEMLANIDLSEVCNIIYSRNLPVPVVDDDVDKTQIETVVKNSIKGRLSVVSKSLISKFRQTGSTDMKPLELLPIFNVNSSENLQDLSRFCEEIEKRLLLERGIEIGSIDKKAQVSTDEINNMNEYAFLSVFDLTNCRKDFCEKVNEKFGKSWTVEHIKDIMYKKEEKESETEEDMIESIDESVEDGKESETDGRDGEPNIE